jgi:acyl dehydratase/NAD(P)-dependent dehydrogenase (short-subunit alcohol dehydrogenase family)
MLTKSTSDIRVNHEDSRTFARLSGDYNPLHLDRIAARRTPFGETVVHGVHLLLSGLEAAAPLWADGVRHLAGLSCVFRNPVPTNAHVRMTARFDTETGRLRLSGEAEHRASFSATVDFRACLGGSQFEADGIDYAPAEPRFLEFSAAMLEAATPLHLCRQHLARLFPELSQVIDPGWIVDLLATTRIIGMECPGLDSTYVACKLRRMAGARAAAAQAMHYRVVRAIEALQLIHIQVTGTVLEGSVEALFRPRPVTQRTTMDVAASVQSGCFDRQRALVVGGSRGLGELTAKILAAGGADVTITFSHGSADAEHVREDITRAGFKCAVLQLDVQSEQLPDWLDAPFSHVYFFASPLIAKNPTGVWDNALFERLASMYVRAFAALTHRMLDHRASTRPSTVIYPSTIFLAEYEPGFAEYCVAKAAGETLCEQLQRQYGVTIHRPRLPRMRTDQTSGAREASVRDSLPIMYDLLRSVHATQTPASVDGA